VHLDVEFPPRKWRAKVKTRSLMRWAETSSLRSLLLARHLPSSLANGKLKTPGRDWQNQRGLDSKGEMAALVQGETKSRCSASRCKEDL